MKKKISILIIMIMVFNVLSGFNCEKKVYATSRTPDEAINYVKSLLGQSIDADGYAGAQCVDLILKYYDYLGVARSSGNGADYTGNTLPDGWQRLQGVQPQKGDILVYTGGYGHVAIYESDRVTYHQNFADNQTVQQISYMYNGLSNPYWGVIRPNWSSNSDTQPPVISNVKVNCNNEYALIECDVTDNVGVARVQAPTWPSYYSSDGCPWYEPVSVNGSHYTFRLNLSDFNNYRGYYMTHIYAWDAAGNQAFANAGVYNMTEDYEKPVISNVKITNMTNKGYTVECDVSDNMGVKNISFPTWTSFNGQDDIRWHVGTINGNHASVRINISDHNNERGQYITHIYLYDQMGNCTSCCGVCNPYIVEYEASKIAEFNGHIYAAFDVEENWDYSRRVCENMGGHLATITSQEEEDLIKDLCGGRIAGYFLGATDEGSEGNWRWITGEAFSYTDWEDNQPDNCGGAENYLELISRSSKWNDIDDQKIRGFVLEMDGDLTPIATMIYNNSIYELYDQSASYPVAQKYCELHDGNLACITSSEENEVVKGLISKGTKQSYFMGGTDKEEEGTWKYVTGEPFIYKNWPSSQPDNYRGEQNYLAIYKDGLWDDACARNFNCGFILEKEIIHVDNISLDKNEIILEEGASDKLTAIFEPTVATNKNISWSVDDNTVATVDGNGNVTAVTAGETDITATTNDGGLTAKCHVVVNPKENPVISNLVIKNKKLSGYTIECDVTDNTEVKDIYLDTWTTKVVKDNEKDDLSSIKGIIEDGHVVFDVDINTHKKEAGEYKNVIRAYDVFSNETQLETENVFIKNGYEPEDVFENDGHIYAIFDIADNYITANDKCIEMEGHLANIESIDEKLAILNNISTGNKKYFISSSDNEKALYIDGNGKVYEAGLNDSVDGFIYELDKDLEPENSIILDNKKYVAYSTCLPWEVAKVYCETHGGYLACINSEEESDTVNSFVSELGNFRYFLGATDKENEGEWKWVTNEEFINDYWEKYGTHGDPDNSSGGAKSEADTNYLVQYGYENYLVIDTEKYGTLNNVKISPFWNDVKSQLVSTGFILEKNIQRVSSINFFEKNYAVKVNETKKLDIVFTPLNPEDKLVSFSSLDEDIAIVDENGNVTGLKEGSAIIRAVSNDGGKVALCVVNVSEIKEDEKVALDAPVVKAVSTKDDSVTLSWQKVDGATEYQIYKYYASSGVIQTSKKVTETTATMHNVKAGKTYRYIVQAVCENGESDNVDKKFAVDAVAGKTGNDAVVPSAEYDYEKNCLTLSWGKKDGVDTYYVYKYYLASKSLSAPKTVKGTSCKYYTAKPGSTNRYLITTKALTDISSYKGKDCISINIPKK